MQQMLAIIVTEKRKMLSEDFLNKTKHVGTA